MLEKITKRLKELYCSRELFMSLVGRDIRARYKGSMLGFLWTLLNPLLMMLIYTVVFSFFMRLNIHNYSLYLFVGLLPWTWFNTSAYNTAACIISNAGLIRKVYFPTEILPAVHVTSNLINYLLSLPIVFAFMLYFKVPFSWALLELPLLLLIQFVFTLGFGFLMATTNVFYRDVEQLLGSLVLVWFYLTPVFYSETMVPAKYQWLFNLNPMTPLMVGYHHIFLQGQWFPLRALWWPVVSGIVILIVGYWIFQRQRYTFAEVV